MSQVRAGVLIAIIVFAAFATYAFLAPAIYQTSALLVVDPVSSASLANWPEPLEAARRLNEAVLDRSTLDKLSRARAGSSASGAIAQAATEAHEALAVDSSDGHTFSIGYKDSDASRAQRVCNELAQHAVSLAPQVLADHTTERAADLKRQEDTQALVAFLAVHPQVAAETPPAADQSPDMDPAISALQAEKSNLERQILRVESGHGSDDPYVDPKQSDVTLLKRRLAEINTGLATRREALASKRVSPPLSPELRAEWKTLLAAVTRANAAANAPAGPQLIAKVTRAALLPTSPIDPNRRLLLFFGLVFGIGLGATFALSMQAAQQRRPKSSRPPKPTEVLARIPVPIPVPAAPLLPSGLGPAVPLTPRLANPVNNAPIVPIAQRQISSNPPSTAVAQLGDGRPAALPGTGGAAAVPEGSTSSRPPARRFASTLVLPPSERPIPAQLVTPKPDPVLVSANQAWEQQIRAHDVPGFAVVKAGSEPPPPEAPLASTLAHTHATQVISSAPPPPAAAAPRSGRSPNQMKVTQPLGSFIAEAMWNDRRSSEPPRSYPPEPAPESRYSYVSSVPGAPNAPPPQRPTPLPARGANPSPPPAAQPQKQVIHAQPSPQGWHPDPKLTPDAQRPLSEQLYAYAVENCFVLAVVGVPESTSHKSRVAAELALSLASSGHPRILLLEGDLHRPLVQRLMRVNMPLTAGFSQQLNERTHESHDVLWTVVSCSKSLDVLAEGMMRSPGLVLSRQFAQCLTDLRSYYDFIVIDGPTASLEVDSGALDAVADGLVTVCPPNGSPALAHISALFTKKRFSAFAVAP
ncbi:MAG: hypothetical protein ABI548_14705 [Polyangiaceae bacterium]